MVDLQTNSPANVRAVERVCKHAMFVMRDYISFMFNALGQHTTSRIKNKSFDRMDTATIAKTLAEDTVLSAASYEKVLDSFNPLRVIETGDTVKERVVDPSITKAIGRASQHKTEQTMANPALGKPKRRRKRKKS